MNRSVLLTGICLLICIPIGTSLAQRVDEESLEGFAVGPTNILIDARPGQRIESVFNIVTRNITKPSRYKIEVMDLGQSELGVTTPVEIGRGARSAANMITVESDVMMQPDEKRAVPVTVSVPANAHGAYFAYLIVQYQPERPQARIGASVRPSAVLMVTVLTRSRAPLHVDVQNLSIVPGTAGRMPELRIQIANTGTWKSTVEGDILMYREGSSFPVRVPFIFGGSEKPIEIYPGCEVNLPCTVNEVLRPGHYRVSTRLILNGKYQSVSHLDLQIPESLYGGTVTGRMISKSESDLDVLVMPSMAELTILPGARRTVPIRIQNRDQRAIRVQARIAEAKMETNGQLTFSEGSTSNNDWISISPLTLELDQRRTGVVKAQITVPSDASEIGALLYAVRINISGPSADDEWNSASEHGVLLVASEPRALSGKLEVSKLELIRSAVNANPSTAVVHLENVGGKVSRYRGEIVLERKSGQSIANMQIGGGGIGQEEIILPGAQRVYRMVLPPLDEGDFRVRTEFTTLGKTQDRISKEETFKSVAEIPEGLE